MDETAEDDSGEEDEEEEESEEEDYAPKKNGKAKVNLFFCRLTYLFSDITQEKRLEYLIFVVKEKNNLLQFLILSK